MNSDKQLFYWIVLPPKGSVGKQTYQLRTHENLLSVYHAFFQEGRTSLFPSLSRMKGKDDTAHPLHPSGF